MARARSPARDKAYEIYKESNGKKLLKDIAVELEVSDAQIRKWKNQDKWDDQMNGNVTNAKGNVTNGKGSSIGSETKGTLDGRKSSKSAQNDKRRSGNPKPVKRFTERNSAALKHGLFSRYMPKETLEIMGMIAGSNPADLIWIQIELQFAAIIRAQQIMFVEDINDMTKEVKKTESFSAGEMESEKEEWEIQFAWDKHASFMNAQSKAISELRSLIKQFNDMAHEEDERRIRLELMAEQVSKLKRDNSTDTSTEDKLKDYFTALGGAFKHAES